MKNWKKVLLLLLVLSPSFFFLSRAFGGNTATLEEKKLDVDGAGAFEVGLSDIDSVALLQDLPELRGTGGFSLGWVKKGDFIRESDLETVRIVKNQDKDFIYLKTDAYEVYFNLSNEEENRQLFKDLQRAVNK